MTQAVTIPAWAFTLLMVFGGVGLSEWLNAMGGPHWRAMRAFWQRLRG